MHTKKIQNNNDGSVFTIRKMNKKIMMGNRKPADSSEQVPESSEEPKLELQNNYVSSSKVIEDCRKEKDKILVEGVFGSDRTTASTKRW
jgi:hypothetical protein